MDGSTATGIVIPIVVAVTLFVWITMVFHADRGEGQPERAAWPR